MCRRWPWRDSFLKVAGRRPRGMGGLRLEQLRATLHRVPPAPHQMCWDRSCGCTSDLAAGTRDLAAGTRVSGRLASTRETTRRPAADHTRGCSPGVIERTLQDVPAEPMLPLSDCRLL